MSGAIVSLSRHTLKQLKFVLPGAVITYLLNTHILLWRLAMGYNRNSGWGRTAALVSLGTALVTIGLFMYILLVHLIQGERPNYRRWRESGVLSSVIPALTSSIVMGWLLMSTTMVRWSSLGLLKGVTGASGLYVLGFGLIGLIPAPKVHRS